MAVYQPLIPKDKKIYIEVDEYAITKGIFF